MEAAPAAPHPKTGDETRVEDILVAFEQVRGRMEQVLTPFIGDKITKKMLAWSFERAVKNHPVLKDTHWSMTGDFLDNGAIESGRLLKSLSAFAGQDTVALVKAALSELLKTRLAAVEQGLGPSLRQSVEKEVGKLEAMLK